jgi:S-disulfanyl-L-cysteine oxidoreductase SoxD
MRTRLLTAGLIVGALVWAQAERSVWDGVYTPEQATRGRTVYAKECASCHGAELGGGESAPPLAGAAFLSNWDGLSVGDLFERVRISMPLNNPGHLSRQDNADVLACILQANRFPEGKVELDKHAEVLKQIKLMANPPAK